MSKNILILVAILVVVGFCRSTAQAETSKQCQNTSSTDILQSSTMQLCIIGNVRSKTAVELKEIVKKAIEENVGRNSPRFVLKLVVDLTAKQGITWIVNIDDGIQNSRLSQPANTATSDFTKQNILPLITAHVAAVQRKQSRRRPILVLEGFRKEFLTNLLGGTVTIQRACTPKRDCYHIVIRQYRYGDIGVIITLTTAEGETRKKTKTVSSTALLAQTLRQTLKLPTQTTTALTFSDLTRLPVEEQLIHDALQPALLERGLVGVRQEGYPATNIIIATLRTGENGAWLVCVEIPNGPAQRPCAATTRKGLTDSNFYVKLLEQGGLSHIIATLQPDMLPAKQCRVGPAGRLVMGLSGIVLCAVGAGMVYYNANQRVVYDYEQRELMAVLVTGASLTIAGSLLTGVALFLSIGCR